MKNKFSIATIILWSVILVLALGAFGFSFYVHVFDGSQWGDSGNRTAEKERTVTQQIDAVKIDWISGDVVFHKSETEEIKIIQKASRSMRERDLFQESVSGRTLTIEAAKRWVFGWNMPRNTTLEIYLPEQEYDSITINGVSCRISGRDLKVRDLTIDTVSGDVDLAGAFDEIEADSVSGRVKFESASLPRRFEADAISGEITLLIPENEGFSLHFSKVSGQLDSDFSMNQNDEEYSYKNGSARFNVDVVSGNLKLRRLETGTAA